MSHDFLWFLSLIAGRTAIVMLALIAGLRLLGKRQIGQMNIYDIAMIMALSNAVQNAMTGGKGDLSVGFVSAGTLLILGWLISLIFVRLPKIETRIVGSPTLILNNGKLLEDRMRREHVGHDELIAAIHQHGIENPGDVLMAVLEVDGTISVVPKTAKHKRIRKN